MKAHTTLVKELVFLLEKGNAHLPFEKAVAGIPHALRAEKPNQLPYSIWQLVEHIRITQWDIVEFCLSEKHVSPQWPEQYWPKAAGPKTEQQWEQSLQQVKADRERFLALLQDGERDLFTPFPYGDGQTLLREALLIADHTAYHTGEILVLRRLLGCWK